jgi:hypothetical protein
MCLKILLSISISIETAIRLTRRLAFRQITAVAIELVYIIQDLRNGGMCHKYQN